MGELRTLGARRPLRPSSAPHPCLAGLVLVGLVALLLFALAATLDLACHGLSAAGDHVWTRLR